MIDLALLTCRPDRLHPVSRMFFEQWLSDSLSTSEFLGWFHRPNSDYLPVTQRLLAMVAGR